MHHAEAVMDNDEPQFLRPPVIAARLGNTRLNVTILNLSLFFLLLDKDDDDSSERDRKDRKDDRKSSKERSSKDKVRTEVNGTLFIPD